MKRAAFWLLAVSMMALLAGCTDSAQEKERIETGVYYGAKFEFQTENGIEYKIVHRAEDVSNLVANLNGFVMKESNERIENWIYRITFVKSLEVSEDRQSIAFSPGEEDLVVLVSENKIQIGDQPYDTDGPFEIIQLKYDSWDHYEGRQESID